MNYNATCYSSLQNSIKYDYKVVLNTILFTVGYSNPPEPKCY